MATRERKLDHKETALAAPRCLNPHPEQVRDSEFFPTSSTTPATWCTSNTDGAQGQGGRAHDHRGCGGVHIFPAVVLRGDRCAGGLRAEALSPPGPGRATAQADRKILA